MICLFFNIYLYLCANHNTKYCKNLAVIYLLNFVGLFEYK